MWNKVKERMKSKVVWLAVIAQVALIVAMFNDAIATELKAICISIVEIATVIGILNNPSDKEQF